MNGIDKVAARIVSDAQQEASALKAETEARAGELKENADRHAAAADVVSDGNVASVNVLDDMRERVGSMLASMEGGCCGTPAAVAAASCAKAGEINTVSGS